MASQLQTIPNPLSSPQVTETLEPTKKAQRGKNFPPVRDIDEIVEKYDFEGNHADVPIVKRIVPVELFLPSTYEDARAIVKIYQAVYQGHFPYPEMLDPAYIYSTFSNPTFFWGVFKTTKRGKIIGCYTVTVDKTTRTGYLRGLNVHPRYQARVGIREMASAVMRTFLESRIDEIDKWYIEARTAHTIVQYLGRTGDLLPYAMMLEKDVFYEQRETDALLISYKRNIRENGRIFPEALPSALIPFYEHANRMMRCGKPVNVCTVEDCSFPTDVVRIRDIQIGKTTDNYGYTYITICDPTSGDVIGGTFTPSVKTLEKVKFHLTDSAMIGTMLAKFHEAAWSLGAEYIEWVVPVSDCKLTAYFMRHPMYTIQGYLPAWTGSKIHPGKYEDAVMFGFTRHPVNPGAMNLIEETQELLEIIISPYPKENYPKEIKIREVSI